MSIVKVVIISFMLISIALLSERTDQASLKTYRTFPTTDVTKYAGITPEELVEIEGEPDEIEEYANNIVMYTYWGDSYEDIGDPGDPYYVTDNNRIDFSNDDAVAMFNFKDGNCIGFTYIEFDYSESEIGDYEDKLELLSDFGVVPGPDMIDYFEDASEDETTQMMIFQNVNDEIVEIGLSYGVFYVKYEGYENFSESEDITVSGSQGENNEEVDYDDLSEDNKEADTDSSNVTEGGVTVVGTGEEVPVNLEYGIYSVTTTADECEIYYDDIDATGQFTVSSSEPSKVCTGGEGSTVLVTLPEGETVTFTPVPD